MADRENSATKKMERGKREKEGKVEPTWRSKLKNENTTFSIGLTQKIWNEKDNHWHLLKCPQQGFWVIKLLSILQTPLCSLYMKVCLFAIRYLNYPTKKKNIYSLHHSHESISMKLLEKTPFLQVWRNSLIIVIISLRNESIQNSMST